MASFHWWRRKVNRRHHGMMCKPCRHVFTGRCFHNLHTNLHSCIVTGLQPLRHFSGSPSRRITLPSLFHNCRQGCRRDAPQNPHGRPDTLCRSLHRQISGKSAVCGQTCCRDHGSTTTSAARCSARRRSCSASAEAVPRPGRRPSAPLPAAGRSAQGTQPAGILQTTAGGAQFGP